MPSEMPTKFSRHMAQKKIQKEPWRFVKKKMVALFTSCGKTSMGSITSREL